MSPLRHRDRRPVPWKNGGGLTWDVAMFPEAASFDDFRWRISIAELSDAGHFSRFDAVERSLAVLTGGLSLRRVNRAELRIESGEALHCFPGEDEIFAVPHSPPAMVMNVMVRRGEWCPEVCRRGSNGSVQRSSLAEQSFLVAAEASSVDIDLEGEIELERFDAVSLSSASSCFTVKRGDVWLISLFRSKMNSGGAQILRRVII